MKKIILAVVTLSVAQFSSAAEKRKLATDRGNCQETAQIAVDSLNKINAPGSSQMIVVLKGSPGQVERYATAGKSPAYRITTVAGRGEGQCFVEYVSFNPEP